MALVKYAGDLVGLGMEHPVCIKMSYPNQKSRNTCQAFVSTSPLSLHGDNFVISISVP